jgi:molybdopterin-binding protein
MKISARNTIKGKIRKIVKGPVSTEVVISVGKGIEIVSVISTASARALGLKKGGEAYAVIKASSVMIAVD